MASVNGYGPHHNSPAAPTYAKGPTGNTCIQRRFALSALL